MDSIDTTKTTAAGSTGAVSLAGAGRASVGDGLTDFARITARGKFLFAGKNKFWVRGISGAAPVDRVDGAGHNAHGTKRRLRELAGSGANALWVHGRPSNQVLEAAMHHGFRLVVVPDVSYTAGFLDDPDAVQTIVRKVVSTIEVTRGQPAILCHALCPMIPDVTFRWHGVRRIERFIGRLCEAVKNVDSDCLVTYENHATAPNLHLPFLDIACFRLGALETGAELSGLVGKLQNLCGEKPLLLSGLCAGGGCSDDEAIAGQLAGDVRTVFEFGGAGVFVETRSGASSRREARIDVGSGAVAQTGHCSELKSLNQAFRESPFATDVDWPRISIVVCSYNGAATIRDTLDGIRALEYPNFQTIVVDDGSTDTTASIAASYDVELISTENRGLSNARNTGWQAADGSIIAYIDDDAYPDPHWLHYLALTFMRTSYVGVGGPNIAPPGDGPIADCVANAPGGPVHVLLTDTEAEHIPGCNMAFKREALSAIDGFDPRYRAAGDDVDLCWRLQERGWKIGFSPAAVVWHHRRNSVLTYWKQQQGYGKAEALLVGKWPEKYNVLGHYTWSGRLYGKGLTRPLRLYDRSVQRRAPVAPVQSMHVGDAGFLATLPLMPEWFVLTGVFGVLALLGLSWSPLRWFVPLLVLSAAVPLTQAALSGIRAEFPTRHPSVYMRMKLRFLTALLHVMQPLARLKGRLQNGLTPWRNRVHRFPTWHFRTTMELAGERSVSPWEFAERLVKRARAGGTGHSFLVRRGGYADGWDVEVVGGLFGNARALVGPRPGAQGSELVARTWSRVSPAALVSLVSGLLVSALAAQEAGWVAATVIGIAAVALALVGCVQAGSAHAALRELVIDAQHRSPESDHGSTT